MGLSDGFITCREEGFVFQGEGLHIGKRMYMYRLSGCNMSCAFCDERAFDDGVVFDVKYEQMKHHAIQSGRVLFTGGEPLLQQSLKEFLDTLLSATTNILVHIETNGTQPLDIRSERLWVTVSPKAQAQYCIRPELQVNELKYVCTSTLKNEHVHVSDKFTTWIMPCDHVYITNEAERKAKNEESIHRAVRMCAALGCRLGIQAHKVWGTP
jgi:organic radical activating enzyme